MSNISSLKMSQTPQETTVTRLKLLLNTNAVLNKWKKLTNASMNRFYRLRELITTEQDYYNDLKTLNEKIKMPLIQSKIISSLIAKQMFTDLENMMLLSKEIKGGLLQKLEQWDGKTTLIGEYMARYSKFLLVYSGYFKNLTETQRKMKELSIINPEIRELEKSLSTSQKIVTIEDLIIKPLQRPLKYSLILKDYCGKLPQTHPDYLPVKNAIADYHKVNEQNNLQMEHKLKDHILIELDLKYGSIIKSQARYYVTQYKALYIETPVVLYVLSDVLILVTELTDKENIRVYLNKYSLVTIPKNEKVYQNGLYLYGESRCIYLRFQNEEMRDQVYFSLKSLIINISQNEFSRQKILAERLNRTTLRQTLRVSSIQETQFVRPLIIKVVGIQKRRISQQTLNTYFVLEFMASPKENNEACLPKQLSFVTWETLLYIQAFIVAMYPQSVRFFRLTYVPTDITNERLADDESLVFELRSIFIQLFLNSIFRSGTILGKIDLICKKLDICDAIWRHLGSSYSKLCFCNYCIEERQFRSFDVYDRQVKERIANKEAQDQLQCTSKSYAKFCEVRTINSQLMIASLPLSILKQATSLQRIAWIKAKKGFINHSLTNIYPSSNLTKLCKLRVWFHSIKGKDYLEIQISPYSRIKQVIDKIGRFLCLDLSDYGLEVAMGEKTYLLSEDEILDNVYLQFKEPDGLISRFFSLFYVDNFTQTFYLKKVWVLQPQLEQACDTQKLIIKTEQIICRLKSQQMRVSDEQTYLIYGYFFAYLHYAQLDTLKQGYFQLKKEELQFMLPIKYKKDKKHFTQIYQKIKEIQLNKKINRNHLLKNILSIVSSKLGWGCLVFRAKQKSKIGYHVIDVRIGCDIQGIQVRHQVKCGVRYAFKFEDSNWSHRVVGDELVIKCSEKQYNFCGRDMWKVHQQYQFYQLYYKTFRKIGSSSQILPLEI